MSTQLQLTDVKVGNLKPVRGGWNKEIPDTPYPTNYPTHMAKVPYHQIKTNKDYEMQDGLFFSKMEGDFLVPDFGFVVQEKI